MPRDSIGQEITIGNKVNFRGKEYTIKNFFPGEGTFGTCKITFEEPQHTDEEASEISVDKVF